MNFLRQQAPILPQSIKVDGTSIRGRIFTFKLCKCKQSGLSTMHLYPSLFAMGMVGTVLATNLIEFLHILRSYANPSIPSW